MLLSQIPITRISYEATVNNRHRAHNSLKEWHNQFRLIVNFKKVEMKIAKLSTPKNQPL